LNASADLRAEVTAELRISGVHTKRNLVRKGGFEKPFQCILNDLQGLGRPVWSLRQHKARLMDCKRTVDSTAATFAFFRDPQKHGLVSPDLREHYAKMFELRVAPARLSMRRGIPGGLPETRRNVRVFAVSATAHP
jgi:hypothetical protein